MSAVDMAAAVGFENGSGDTDLMHDFKCTATKYGYIKAIVLLAFSGFDED